MEGRALLGMHFIQQATPDIRRKLQKLRLGPGIPIEDMLGIASSVFYNRDQEEEERALETEKHEKKQAQLLAALLGQRTQGPQKGKPKSTPSNKHHKHGKPGH